MSNVVNGVNIVIGALVSNGERKRLEPGSPKLDWGWKGTVISLHQREGKTYAWVWAETGCHAGGPLTFETQFLFNVTGVDPNAY